MTAVAATRPSLAYTATHARSPRRAHTREHYNDKDRGTAIGAVVGFAVGAYLSTFTAPAATGAGGPGAGVAAVVATVGGCMAIGAGLGGAIGTIVGEGGEDPAPASQGGGQGNDPGGSIGVGPFGRGDGGWGEGDGGGEDGGGGEGGGCFLAGTPVLLADGRRVPIETVAVGDLLASRPATYATSRIPLDPQPATQLYTHHVADTLLLHLSNGTTLHTTRQHRFFVAGLGFISAGRLTPGTTLTTHNHQLLTVLSTTPLHDPATVYNLEIATHHTFFVGDEGIWVHNMKDDEGDGDTTDQEP